VAQSALIYTFRRSNEARDLMVSSQLAMNSQIVTVMSRIMVGHDCIGHGTVSFSTRRFPSLGYRPASDYYVPPRLAPSARERPVTRILGITQLAMTLL
jgi:hypothetical protein